MKTIISILIIFLVLTGCESRNVESKSTEYRINGLGSLQLVTIDGCEYLYGPWGNATVLTHKGNCINHTYSIK